MELKNLKVNHAREPMQAIVIVTFVISNLSFPLRPTWKRIWRQLIRASQLSVAVSNLVINVATASILTRAHLEHYRDDDDDDDDGDGDGDISLIVMQSDTSIQRTADVGRASASRHSAVT